MSSYVEALNSYLSKESIVFIELRNVWRYQRCN